MPKKEPLPLTQIVEFLLHDAARNLSLAPWRPHRAFHGDTSEALPKRFTRVKSLYDRSRFADTDYIARLINNTITNALDSHTVPDLLHDAFTEFACALAGENELLFGFGSADFIKNLTTTEQREITDKLIDREYLLTNEDRIIGYFAYGLALLTLGMYETHFPKIDAASPATTHVPLIDLIPNPAGCIEAILITLFSDLNKSGDPEAPPRSFAVTRAKLWRNVLNTSQITDEQAQKTPYKIILPTAAKLSPPELVASYLTDTPFQKLFRLSVPFSIPLKTYAEHGFIFAKSGHGKSQTMRTILADLIDKDCALFLLDGNGALIENVDKIAGIKDRLVILDPEEEPALNFFSMNGVSREKQMELFFYLFKAIDQGLTERQATMISYLVDLMQSISGSTLDTLREVCESKAPLFPTDTLEPITQSFFANQFYSRDALINQTKAQIAARLYTIGRNRLFNAMFSATENKFNALQLMQEKSVVIVNTTRDKLGDQGSAVFGRYILAQCLAAAWQRPKHQRHLCLLMVDEAKTYLDDQSKKILSDARAFGLGLLLASQFPDQLEDGVRKEVINNTSVKFAGPAAYSVVAQIHRDMRCDPAFIMDMKKVDYSHAEWACYVDNLTPQAIKLTIPFGALEKLPKLSPAEHQALRQANRERFTASKPSSPPKPQGPPEASGPAVPKTDIELANTVTRRLETLLEKHYGAFGRGLHEKITSVADKLPPDLLNPGRYVATMRNNVMHVDNFALPDREWFLKCAEIFERHFAAAFPSSQASAPSDAPKNSEAQEYDTDI